jgi:hypothetical protein
MAAEDSKGGDMAAQLVNCPDCGREVSKMARYALLIVCMFSFQMRIDNVSQSKAPGIKTLSAEMT